MRELNGGVEAEIEMYSGNLPQAGRREGGEGDADPVAGEAGGEGSPRPRSYVRRRAQGTRLCHHVE